jgi:2-polyprenyl-3-methyl-5-hydroxy-6-metoxy-1,4-benzoquinol methylase
MKLIKTLTSSTFFFDQNLRPLVALDQEAEALKNQLNEKLKSGELETEDVPCLCGNEEFFLIADIERYGVLQRTVMCKSCGLIQGMPRMSQKACQWFYSSDFYRKLYDSNLMGFTEQAIIQYAKQDSATRFNFVKSISGYDSIKSVLEIGCAGGWNLLPYHTDGKTVMGFDLGPNFVSVGKKLGMDLRVGSIEQIPIEAKFDLIVLSHVVEHLPNPPSVIQSLKKHLSESGRMYIEVPNMDHFGMGQLQSAHLYYFTPRTLVAYMAQVGLVPIQIKEGVTGSHVGGVFCPQDTKTQDVKLVLSNEANRMTRKIKQFELKQRVKRFLQKFGIARNR